MKRDLLYAGVFWIVLTAIGEYVAFAVNIFPPAAAEEALIIDEAFDLLMVLGIPVFTFVLAGLVFAFLRYRVPEDSIEDGPPIRTHRGLTWSWFMITSALAVLVIINPGITGLRDLQRNPNEDLVVQVETEQWQWNFTYPQYGVTLAGANELVLPVDQRVKFEITSLDVIHSMWVPAFRMKMDAVPGQTNVMYVTPDETGDMGEHSAFRVQCAELCGTGHPRMRAGLRIVSGEEFEAWIESNQ